MRVLSGLVLRLAWSIVLFIALCAPCSAATYYVRATGHDTNDGLTPASAFATISYAATRLLAPGDRVIVGAGRYTDGNIGPAGSGSRDLPVAFSGDPSGALTGDAGEVLIVPTRETGFLLLGRHDILIEGFTIEGAIDAGIQARFSKERETDSTRITIRQNTIRNSAGRGIHVTAVGDVTIASNRLLDNAMSGISLLGGQEGEIRPTIRENEISGGFVGLAIEGANGGSAFTNEIHGTFRGIGIVASRGIHFMGNHIVGTEGEAVAVPGTASEEEASRDLRFTQNRIETTAGSGIALQSVAGELVFENNVLAGEGPFAGGQSLSINALPLSHVSLIGNQAGYVSVNGDADVEIRGQTAATGVELSGRSIVARTNRFSGHMVVRARLLAEVSGNDLPSLHVDSAEMLIADNIFSSGITLTASSAVVRDNLLDGNLLLTWRGADPATGESFEVVRNQSRFLAVGLKSSPVPTAVVSDNRAALFVSARRMTVQRNQVAGAGGSFGIECSAGGADDSLVEISGNVVRDSSVTGIRVIGTNEGSILANEVAGNAGTGILVRRSRNLTIRENRVGANRDGGIGINLDSLVPGDCDNSGAVTVDEIITAVEMALHASGIDQCPSIDVSDDDRITVDEIILAVDTALHRPPVTTTGAVVVISDNQVEGNERYGIDAFAGGPMTLRANRVLANGGSGMSAQIRGSLEPVEVIGNVVGESEAEGIFIGRAMSGRVGDNIVFGNGQAGVLLRNAHELAVVGNLIYANGNDGISVGVGRTGPLASPNTLLMNNTLYGNGGWGVTIGTTRDPSLGTRLLNNIIEGNARGGVGAELSSQAELTVAFNLNNDGYSSGIQPSATDFQAEPRFADPAGADEHLGGAGYADDDFHLLGGDDPYTRSAAIDAGSATAIELGITGSAVAGMEGDEGVVDLGYHYPSGL